MPRAPKPPAYRLRVIRGRQIAYVRLRDTESGRIRDVWLGEYGSAQSREFYARELAEWEARGRRIQSNRELIAASDGPSIAQILREFQAEVCRAMAGVNG